MGRKLGQLLLGYRPGTLGRSALLGTAGFGVRSIIQAAYLLIVSRWLGAEHYGFFAGSVALAVLVAPAANWGSSLLLTRYIAVDPGCSRAMWATALLQTALVGGLLALCVVIASTFLPQRLPLWPMLALAVSELILLPIVWAAASQCYALERGGASALAICLSPATRLCAMTVAIACGLAATPAHAAIAHFLGTLIAVVAAVLLMARVDGWPNWQARLPSRKSLREGTPYAVSSVAGNSYLEVDKFLMLQSLGAAVVGPYTVAFRVACIFVMPIMALINSVLPRLLARSGTEDGARTYSVMLLVGLGYGVVAGAVILAVTPSVPRIFGLDYSLASHYLALLAAWPALFALRQSLASQLMAQHRHVVRSLVEAAALGIVVVLNLLLLPRLGPEAAILVLLVTEIWVVVAMGLLVGRSFKPKDSQQVRRG